MNELIILVPLGVLASFYHFCSRRAIDEINNRLPIGLVPLYFGENSIRYAEYIAQCLANGEADEKTANAIAQDDRKEIDTHLPSLKDIVRNSAAILREGKTITVLTDGQKDIVWLEMDETGTVNVCLNDSEDNSDYFTYSTCLYAYLADS